LAKKRRAAFVAPAPPPGLVPSLINDANRTKSIAAITNLLDADPEFYLHVEQVSREKLRRDALESRSLSREPHPAAIKDTPSLGRLSPAKSTPVDKLNTGSKRGDVRWRTLVRLSYQKAKFCAQLLRVGQKDNSRRATTVVAPTEFMRSHTTGVDVSPLRCSSVVELSVTAQVKEEVKPRRGRSRSDAFIITSNLWRPNVGALLSNSAPAATPSAVSVVSEWVPTSHVLAA
jgi:hypothetical protein